MPIKSITVQADYCFGLEPLRLRDLNKVNFIFAPNGAGKSTISSMLARQPTDPDEREKWDVAPTRFPIRVFNEAYRSRVLTEHVNGIFTLAETSEDAIGKIDTLRRQIRDRDSKSAEWRAKIGSNFDRNDLSGLLGEIECLRIDTRKSVFDAHKKLDESVIAIVFKGYRRSQENFFNEACRRFEELHTLNAEVDWESLKVRAQSLGTGSEVREKLPVITIDSLISEDDIAEVASSSPHKQSGGFADLIQQLKNEDWVSKGREYVADAQGQCPFCQNRAPVSLAQDLAQYFQSGFDAALQSSIRIKETAERQAERLEAEITALETALSKDAEIARKGFDNAIELIRASAKLLLAQLRERSGQPTQPIQVSDVGTGVASLAQLVDTENEKIDQHNLIVENADDERAKLINDGWVAFLSQAPINSEMKKFIGVTSRKNRSIEVLRGQISENEELNRNDYSSIAELQPKVSNSDQVAEKINKLLHSMGFHRFKLSSAEDSNGSYRLIRADGTPAFDSLSEGEKTFICFAYYWESLFGSEVAGNSAEDVVAVIDDPISSLDSDALFMIAAYVRDAAKQVQKESSNLRQLIILTHNTQFHHEAAYAPVHEQKERRYFRLVKELTGVTTVREDGNESKIRGSYALLWHSVVEAARIEDESDLIQVGVFNIVRRIIEGYFKTIGNVKEFDRIKGAQPHEQRMVSQFHIWANSGSHIIADDVDQTVDVGRVKDFLRQFRQYFDIQGHGAHFDMMVTASGGEDLLEPDQLFTRAGTR